MPLVGHLWVPAVPLVSHLWGADVALGGHRSLVGHCGSLVGHSNNDQKMVDTLFFIFLLHSHPSECQTRTKGQKK